VATVVRTATVREDPVGFWKSRLSELTRRTYEGCFRRFLAWLQTKPEWRGVDGRGLLMRQMTAADPYAILDLVQEYSVGMDAAKRTKLLTYHAVRSFFAYNRCALPADRAFKIRDGRPTVSSKLTLNHVIDLVKGASIRDRSIILVKWQSLLDNERLVYVSNHLAEQVVNQMRNGVHPVRLDIPYRKQNQDHPWFTFIGKDAVDALTTYFDKVRGWPQAGEPIWILKGNLPFSNASFKQQWIRLTRRIGLIEKKKGKVGTRYGYNPHELRDIAKSLLHTHAKRDGFDMDFAEFMLGHVIDEDGYDKFFNDQEYVRKQYLIAEPYLNILSRSIIDEEQRRREQEEVDRIRNRLEEVEKLLSRILPTREHTVTVKERGGGPS